jgi:ribosomal protein S18 acetylase RimI-like enzyme
VTRLRWAVPQRCDDPAWLDLLTAIEAADHRGEIYEAADIDDEWASVWAHPDTDAMFVWDGSELVAFAWLKARPGEREAHKVGCWGGVRPSHRRRGIGTEVLDWSMTRATEVAATFDAGLPTKLEADAGDHQRDLLAITERAGFRVVRRFLELARPTAAPVPSVPAPLGLELVPWTEALDEETRLAQREAFASHWGSEPPSVDAWRQWFTGHRSFRADLSLLALDPSSGQVASLVLTGAYPQDWDLLPVEAWINTVGTRPAWRGQGVARWVMGEVLRRIADSDTGFERSILGVDSENPTGALGLYRSLGFDEVRAVNALCRPPLS